MNDAARAAWHDALQAAALFAVDPAGLGGVLLRARAGPVRERWLAACRALLPPELPQRTLPTATPDDRLLGGLDLAATLRSARPVAQRGLLADVHGGVLTIAMAERLDAGVTARLVAALDRGELQLAREGVAMDCPARFGALALDEGEDDEAAPAALADRLAIRLDLNRLGWRETEAPAPFDAAAVQAARSRWRALQHDESALEPLCAAALALGIASPRAPWLALRVARAAAALAGRDAVAQEDAELAARLVLAPRATSLPPAPADDDTGDDTPPPDAGADPPDADPPPSTETGPIEERVIEAARAALEAGLLARLQVGASNRARSAGRAGALAKDAHRGRPAGVRRAPPRKGARLDLIATLRAAAPWQRLRRQESPGAGPRVRVRSDDFHVTRRRPRSRTLTLFAIDASGSSALHRLAEAKGAVELLLADCYVRRDEVAVLAFRGQAPELLLPPTRSLVRAKRELAALPGGGGTPLAGALEAAWLLAEAARRRGDTPILVLLTDGRANIALDGRPDRPQAEADALACAARWRATGLPALLVDTSARPEPRARALAEQLHATYLPLPQAEAATLAAAVRAAAG